MKTIKKLKKILMIFICLFVGIISADIISFKITAQEQLEDLVVNGYTIKYRNTGQTVKINKEHDPSGGEFRGVWVSALTSDISGYVAKSSYQKQMIDVLKNMEKYNLNTMIFHVRMMNDAFYPSKYNNWSSYYNTDPDWDMLPWLIEECHKRGIEFHAWMNPYRVTSSVSGSLQEIASLHKATNAASNPQNLLKASKGIILNPGEPAVREFLVNTCMELATNYDIDAIHFDDYFYAAGIDDSETVRKYNKDNLSIDNFRRLQVDLFIEQLHNELTEYNNKSGKRVQLGIAPTGVYRNGNGIVSYDDKGNAITNGSPTSAYAHYGSPLYADTLKWINNGWIDYILPQSYWAITNSAGPHCDLVKWWNDVCANKKTNLYSSLGLYMSSGGGNASWGTNKKEGYQQIMFGNTLEHVKGSSIYNYLSMVSSLNSQSAMQGVRSIWDKAIYVPEIRTVSQIIPSDISNLKVCKTDYGNKISFDNNEDAKFYCIYRSEQPLTYDEEEIIDVIGSYDEVVEYTDYNSSSNKTYYYGVKAQSRSNTLGNGASVSTEGIVKGDNLSIGQIENIIISDNLLENEEITLKFDNINYPYGDEVKYLIDYTFKNNEEVLEVVRDCEVISESGRNSIKINIPSNASDLSLLIKGYNNCGETIEVINQKIGKTLGIKPNISIKGSYYSDQQAELIFQNPNISNAKYILQTSKDGFVFNDYLEITDYTALYNIRTNIKLSSETGNLYYRLKVISDDKCSYSNVLLINQKRKVAPIEKLLIQNKNDYNILVSEGDTLSLKWNKGNQDLQYMCYFSMDNKMWTSIKIYDSSSVLSIDSNKCYQDIEISYKYFRFYLKIVGTNHLGETESDIITVNVKIDMIFSDELTDYIINNNDEMIDQMDILK